MLNYRDPDQFICYSPKEIRGMREAWFWVGAGTGSVICTIAFLIGLRWIVSGLID